MRELCRNKSSKKTEHEKFNDRIDGNFIFGKLNKFEFGLNK